MKTERKWRAKRTNSEEKNKNKTEWGPTIINSKGKNNKTTENKGGAKRINSKEKSKKVERKRGKREILAVGEWEEENGGIHIIFTRTFYYWKTIRSSSK